MMVPISDSSILGSKGDKEQEINTDIIRVDKGAIHHLKQNRHKKATRMSGFLCFIGLSSCFSAQRQLQPRFELAANPVSLLRHH